MLEIVRTANSSNVVKERREQKKTRCHFIDSIRDPKNRLTETIGRPKVAAWPSRLRQHGAPEADGSHVAQSGREGRSGPDDGHSENDASL